MAMPGDIPARVDGAVVATGGVATVCLLAAALGDGAAHAAVRATTARQARDSSVGVVRFP